MSDVALTDKILEQLDEVGVQLKHCQDTNDRLLKQYDGLDVDNIRRNADEAAKKYEDTQAEIRKAMAFTEKYKDLELKNDELIERVKGLETEIAKAGPSDAQKESFKKDYTEQMTKYLRRGVVLKNELVENLCRMNVQKGTFGADDATLNALVQKELISSVGPDGGYFLMPERSASIVERIFESSPIRAIANVVQTSAHEWEQPIDDGEYDCGWVEETQGRPDTATSDFAMVRIPVNEMYARPRVTQKMLDDAGFNVEGWMNRRVADRFGRKEANAFVVGDGAGKPKGFTDYSAWTQEGVYERGKIEVRVGTGTAGTLDAANDVIQLQSDLLEPYQAAAVWGMHRKTFTDICTITDEQGQYLINAAMLREGADKVLLGKPVVMMGDMPQVAANAKSVVYADFSQFYTIVDRFGIRVLRDPYTEKPFVLLYTTRRVGGGVTNFQAGKILQINA